MYSWPSPASPADLCSFVLRFSMRFVYGLAGLVLVLAFVSHPVLVMSFSSGAPAAFNGSPVSLANGGGDCTACHGSFELNSGTGSVSINAPMTFVPGETVTFTVAVDNTTPPANGTDLKQGFQVSVEDDAAGAHVGTLVILDETNTQFATETYVTHTDVGNAESTWTVGWTAPDDAPDEVTIYVAGNAANFNFSPTGDYIYTDSFTMTRNPVANEDAAAPLAARFESVYPNPAVSSATVAYTLDRPLAVTVTLFDGVGRTVRVLENGARGAGTHTVAVNADGLSAGTYFVQIRSEAGTEVRPLTVSR